MKRLPTASLLLLLCCASCSFFDLNEPLLELRTDRQTYSLCEGDTVKITVENNAFRTIHYNQCMGMSLEALDGNRVVATFGFPVCACLCFDAFERGEELEFSVDLGWFRQYNGQFGQELPLRSGHRYRVRFTDFYEDRAAKKQLDEESRLTNRFEIRPDTP